MFDKNLKKAIDAEKDNISKIFYDKEAQSYVATNGHIMLVEKTEDIYDSDKFVSPLTGLEEDCKYVFPSWERVIPTEGNIISNRSFKVFFNSSKKDMIAREIALIDEGIFVNKKYLEIVLSFIGGDYILTQDKKIDPLKFISFDGKKTALIMPLKIDLICFSKTDIVIDGCKACKSSNIRARYVYIAFEKTGEVRAVFSKESDAIKETKNGKVLEKVIL